MPHFQQSLLHFSFKARTLHPAQPVNRVPAPSIAQTPKRPKPRRKTRPNPPPVRRTIADDAFEIADRLMRGERPTPPKKIVEEARPQSDEDFDHSPKGAHWKSSSHRKNTSNRKRARPLRDDRASMTKRSANAKRTRQRVFDKTDSARRLFDGELSGTDEEPPVRSGISVDGLETAERDDRSFVTPPRRRLFHYNSQNYHSMTPDHPDFPSQAEQSPPPSPKPSAKRRCRNTINDHSDADDDPFLPPNPPSQLRWPKLSTKRRRRNTSNDQSDPHSLSHHPITLDDSSVPSQPEQSPPPTPKLGAKRGRRNTITQDSDSDDDHFLLPNSHQNNAQDDDDDVPIAARRRRRRNTITESDTDDDIPILPASGKSKSSAASNPRITPLSNEVIELSDSDSYPATPTATRSTRKNHKRSGSTIILSVSPTPTPPSTKKRRPLRRLQIASSSVDDDIPIAHHINRQPKPSNETSDTPKSKEWFHERDIDEFSDSPNDFQSTTPKQIGPSTAGRRRVTMRHRPSPPVKRNILKSLQQVNEDVESLHESDAPTRSPSPVRNSTCAVGRTGYKQTAQAGDDVESLHESDVPKQSAKPVAKRTQRNVSARKFQPPRFTQEKGIVVEDVESLHDYDAPTQHAAPLPNQPPTAQANNPWDNDDDIEFLDLVDMDTDNAWNSGPSSTTNAILPTNRDVGMDSSKPPPFNLIALCLDGETVTAMKERLGEEHVMDKVTEAQKSGREIIGGEELGLTGSFNTSVFSRFSKTVVGDHIGKGREMQSVTEEALRGEFKFNYRGRGQSPARKRGNAAGNGGRRPKYFRRGNRRGGRA